MRSLASSLAMALLFGAAGCATGGDDSPGTDSGMRSDARVRDAGRPRDGGRMLDAGRPRDGGARDAGSRDGGGPRDSGPRDSGPRDTGPPTCVPTPGTLVIVEVMISSRSGSGDRGEWLEVVNTGTCAVSMAGLVLASAVASGGEATHAIGATAPSIAAGEHYVLAQSANPADNHLLPFDYAYGTGASTDVTFNNAADWVELRDGSGTALDRVSWPSGGFTHGAARGFPGTPSATGNDTWASWCDSRMVYSTAGGTFYGTPGMSNETCP